MNPKVPFRADLEVVRGANDREDWSGTVAAAERLLNRWPDTSVPGVFLLYSRALGQLGRLNDAEAVLARGVDQAKPHIGVWYMWAIHPFRAGDLETAEVRLTACERQFGAEGDGRILLPLAIVFAFRDKLDEARTAFIRYVGPELQPHASTIELVIAVIAKAFGPSLAEQILDIHKAIASRHDEEIALQHVRNLIYAIGYSVLPPEHAGLHAALAQVVNAPSFQGSMLPLVRLLNADAGGRPRPVPQPCPVPQPRPKRARILLLTAYFPLNEAGPHMRFVNSIAGALALSPEFESVVILMSQEYGPEGPRVQDGEFDDAHQASWRADIDALAGREAAARIEFITPRREGPVYPLASTLTLAAAAGADLMIAIQGIFASPVAAGIIARDLPTIAIQTNRDNPEASYADLMLSHGRRSSFENKPRPQIWRQHRIPVLAFPKKACIAPEVVGPSVALRIATALSHGRLENLLLGENGAVLERIGAFLKKHPLTGWTMFGVQDADRLESEIAARLPADAAQRITICGFVADLREHLEHCHIYFQPLGDSGGGMAVAMALAEELAVLVPSSCDAANFLPNVSLFEDQSSGFEKLSAIARNATLRHRMLERQSEVIASSHSLKAYADAFPRYFRQALNNFRIRTND